MAKNFFVTLPDGQGMPLCLVTLPSGPPGSKKIENYNSSQICTLYRQSQSHDHIFQKVQTPVGRIWSMGQRGGEVGHRVKSHAFHDQREPFPGEVICLTYKLFLSQICEQKLCRSPKDLLLKICFVLRLNVLPFCLVDCPTQLLFSSYGICICQFVFHDKYQRCKYEKTQQGNLLPSAMFWLNC